MTAEDFATWSEAQPDDTRYELFDGEIFAMAPERVSHARMKHAITRQFEDAIRDDGLTCEALPDGMAVRIDDQTVFAPDALVRCGPRLAPDTVLILDPIIVVEVASPSTQRIDALMKFRLYFDNPAIRHYLIVITTGRTVIHHARRADGGIETASYTEGRLMLDPPGLSLDVSALFEQIEG